MGIGVSIFLLATGAVLSWGVESDPNQVNLDNIGLILMLVGGLGLLMSLLLLDDWAPWSRRRRDTAVNDERITYERVLPEEVVLSEPLPRQRVAEEPLVRRRVTNQRTYR